MKKTLIWVGGVIGVSAVMALCFGALQNQTMPKTIAVNGECLTSVPKDKTAITLRITTLAKNALESMQTASAKMAEITEYLKTQPVETQTTQFNSFEKTEWNRDAQKSEPLGIETNIAVEVSANDIQTIENLLSKFAGQENVFTENLRVYTSPAVIKSAQEKCLGRALENARLRADALISGDKKRAGKLLSVSYGATTENNHTYGGVMRTMLTSAKGAADMAAGTITAKDTDVSVVISAVFEIK